MKKPSTKKRIQKPPKSDPITAMQLVAACEQYLINENHQVHAPGEDARLMSKIIDYFAQPFMAESRTKTVAIAKRVLKELRY